MGGEIWKFGPAFAGDVFSVPDAGPVPSAILAQSLVSEVCAGVALCPRLGEQFCAFYQG